MICVKRLLHIIKNYTHILRTYQCMTVGINGAEADGKKREWGLGKEGKEAQQKVPTSVTDSSVQGTWVLLKSALNGVDWMKKGRKVTLSNALEGNQSVLFKKMTPHLC